MATLVAPLRVDLRAFVEGGLEAGAVVAGAFEVAGLGTALRASVSSTWEHELRTRVDLQYRDGRLDFHNDTSFEADFALQAKLESVLRASLLGWTWEATWPLATRDVKKHWRTGGLAEDPGTDIPGRMLFDIADRVVDIVNLLSSVLTSIKPTEDAKPVGQGRRPGRDRRHRSGSRPRRRHPCRRQRWRRRRRPASGRPRGPGRRRPQTATADGPLRQRRDPDDLVQAARPVPDVDPGRRHAVLDDRARLAPGPARAPALRRPAQRPD